MTKITKINDEIVEEEITTKQQHHKSNLEGEKAELMNRVNQIDSMLSLFN